MKIEHLSVSQIRTYLRNPRRWVLEKLEGLPTCSTPATSIGKMVHQAIEEYLTGMPNTEEHALADHCLRALCDSDLFLRQLYSSKYDVELEILHYVDPQLPPLKGFIDLVIWDYHHNCPMIMDHKTSKTRKFFKSAKELKKDLQLIVYSHWILLKCPKAKGVFVQHNQFAYGNKRDVLQHKGTFICRKRIEKGMQDIAKIMREMMVLAKKFEEIGINCVGVSKCETCNSSFGPNSCEYSCICQGVCNEDGYRKAYNAIQEVHGNVTRWEISEALAKPKAFFDPIENLTNNDVNDIIKVSEEIDMIRLDELVGKARKQVQHLSSTWDKREAITKAVVAHILEQKVSYVVVPSHFIGGVIDPDYMPIVTQLKENNIQLHIEI